MHHGNTSTSSLTSPSRVSTWEYREDTKPAAAEPVKTCPGGPRLPFSNVPNRAQALGSVGLGPKSILAHVVPSCKLFKPYARPLICSWKDTVTENCRMDRRETHTCKWPPRPPGPVPSQQSSGR